MTQGDAFLSTGGRPKPLLRAARAGLAGYDRRRALTRLLGPERPRTTREALDRLSRLEAHADGARMSGAPGYSPIRHVELLVAVMAEARLQRA